MFEAKYCHAERHDVNLNQLNEVAESRFNQTYKFIINCLDHKPNTHTQLLILLHNFSRIGSSSLVI